MKEKGNLFDALI